MLCQSTELECESLPSSLPLVMHETKASNYQDRRWSPKIFILTDSLTGLTERLLAFVVHSKKLNTMLKLQPLLCPLGESSRWHRGRKAASDFCTVPKIHFS